MIRKFVLLTSLLTLPASAHDLWLAPEDDNWRLHYGHRPEGHEGATELLLPAEWILTAEGVVGDGARVELDPPGGPYSDELAALRILVSSGYWSRTPEGTVNRPRTAVEHAFRSWRSLEVVKALIRWQPRLAEALSEELELLPLADPFSLRPGDKLRMRALWRGRPAAGVTVAYDGNPRGLTDEKGRVNLRIRHGGLQHIQATLETALDSPEAEWLLQTATLNFVLLER